MRIARTAKNFVLQLNMREKHLLFELLKLYPRVPLGHSPLSKSAQGKEAEANQRLLDEALAEQRAENRRQVQALLNDPSRCREHKAGCRLALSAGDLEGLLQVLNDIRVGSWVILGSPEEIHELALLNETTAPHFWAMEFSGLFQQQLIEALEQGDS